MFHNVYRGKRVFVSGHTGFKGSWLCAWLVSLGAEVTGYSRDIPTNPSHFEAMHLAGHMHDVRGDIRDREHLCRAVAEAKPDIVFHLAAQALVRLSYDRPVETFEANVLGTLNVLEAVRACDSATATTNRSGATGKTIILVATIPIPRPRAVRKSLHTPTSRVSLGMARAARQSGQAMSSAAETGLLIA